MPRVLVRSGKSPLTALSAEASLARNGWGVFGANVGNLLFTSAVHRAVSVPGTDVVSNSLLTELPGTDKAYIDKINADYDSFVIPLANAFRPSFESSLRRLTRVVQQLTIPVVVVGVGTQLRMSGNFDGVPQSLKEATREFVAAVLDRSSSIGVRGEMTLEFLRHLGFDDDSVDVIGCPSLFHDGPNRHVVKRLPSLDKTSHLGINITPSVSSFAPVVHLNTALYPNMVYVPQEHYELAMMMWGEPSAAKHDRRIPTHLDHQLYREDRVRFFLDASTWIGHLSAMDFVFGTRIHGNIAALLGDTPAVVVAHDSRTLELAEYHHIPYRLSAELSANTDAAELYESADYSRFNAEHPRLFETYRRFLDRNSVDHIWNPGKANPQYDAQVEAAAFPPPVRNASAKGSGHDEILSRLRWLRQGNRADQGRVVGGYEPPFAPSSDAPLTVEHLKARVERQEKALREQERTMQERLAEVTADHGKRLEELERVIDELRATRGRRHGTRFGRR